MADEESVVAKIQPEKLLEGRNVADEDDLEKSFKGLSIGKKSREKAMKAGERLTPGEFLQMQSIRSSAMAQRTKTSTKFGPSGQELCKILVSEEVSGDDGELDDILEGTKNMKIDDREELLCRAPMKQQKEQRKKVAPYPAAQTHQSRDTQQQLPDDIIDYILEYCRCNYCTKHFSPSLSSHSPSSGSPSNDGGSVSAWSTSSGSPPSGSPLSGALPSPPPPINFKRDSDEHLDRREKARFQKLFSEEAKLEAWAWVCKCNQLFSASLNHQDMDGDSLLHIVTWHCDLPKIYALVEQMVKNGRHSREKPLDTVNRSRETALFLAVEKRLVDVVKYLLEAGADPNVKTLRPERGAALHHAASRGMTDIVQALCQCPNTEINQQNDLGLTPILCAVRNHAVIEEASGALVNNIPAMRELIKAGVDITIQDENNGKNVLHYAVEKMDPRLIEILRDYLDPRTVRQLSATKCRKGQTPVELLSDLVGSENSPIPRADENQSASVTEKMFAVLSACARN